MFFASYRHPRNPLDPVVGHEGKRNTTHPEEGVEGGMFFRNEDPAEDRAEYGNDKHPDVEP